MANQLDAIFAALSDPTRRAVLERLADGPAPVMALHAHHDMALPSFLKHLKTLESAGLVRSRKSGRVRIVHLEATPFTTAADWIDLQRHSWERRLDRLEALTQKGPKT